MKLEIELVPKTCFGKNLRNLMDKSDWDVLRRDTYYAFGYKCGICLEGGQLHCHEIWEYDEDNRIQRLKGFIALCPLCHRVKHYGHTMMLAEKGELDLIEVVEHFMKVNECTHEEFLRHRAVASLVWKRRSKFNWALDLGKYKEWIEI
jgi:hypothetical protein